MDLFHDLDLSDEFHTVVIVLCEALNALDGDNDASVPASGLDNGSERALANFLKNLIVLSDLHPN